MGKGWAKGLTAATDRRVAAMAEGHRGKRYVRRKPIDECAWPLSGKTTLPLKWSSDMAYVVGLTATDGCLLTGRRQINFKSQDRDLVATYLELLGRANRVHERCTGSGRPIYVTQFGDAALYRWFESVGLTPRKSLTLGALAVPDEYLLPLVRGLLDGDGSVINRVYRADTGRRGDYYWEYLLTKFYSASRAHLEWLAAALARHVGVEGYLSEVRPRSDRASRNSFFHLRFGKRASLVLLPRLYPDGAPCLERKREIWRRYAAQHRIG